MGFFSEGSSANNISAENFEGVFLGNAEPTTFTYMDMHVHAVKISHAHALIQCDRTEIETGRGAYSHMLK